MAISLAVNLLGVVLFLFLLWRRLKEDYSREIVFGTACLVLLGLLIGYLTAFKFFPAWFFWLEAFGAFLGFTLAVFKYDVRFFETFEAVFLGFLPWLTFFYLKVFLAGPGVLPGVLLVFSFLLIFFAGFINRRYKNFGWYKSGRIGLAGLLTAGIFFLVRTAIATFFPFMVSFPGRSEIVLSGISSFAIFLLIYNLARSEV